MVDFFEFILEYSYLGIFFLLILVNAAPLLMPPTWIILASFYVIDSSYDPLILALVGATGATLGRFILKQIATVFRRFVQKEQKSNLDAVGSFLNKKKFGYVLTSFLFAATPLPSNILFVTYGLLKAKSIGLYVGFWAGRVASYYLMISISNIVLTPFVELFEERYIGILIADALGISVIIFFTCINWTLLLSQRKFKLTKPKILRL